jgi:hypothetical protein
MPRVQAFRASSKATGVGLRGDTTAVVLWSQGPPVFLYALVDYVNSMIMKDCTDGQVIPGPLRGLRG